MPTLYDFTMAPSPRRARIFLAEKGLVCANVQVNLMTGEHLGDAFRALNPVSYTHLTLPTICSV